MSELIRYIPYWIDSNDADSPENAELLLIALGQPDSNWDIFTVSREGERTFVRGPVSTLVLDDQEALEDLRSQLTNIVLRE